LSGQGFANRILKIRRPRDYSGAVAVFACPKYSSVAFWCLFIVACPFTDPQTSTQQAGVFGTAHRLLRRLPPTLLSVDLGTGNKKNRCQLCELCNGWTFRARLVLVDCRQKQKMLHFVYGALSRKLRTTRWAVSLRQLLDQLHGTLQALGLNEFWQAHARLISRSCSEL
jgi:hypothetical protein